MKNVTWLRRVHSVLSVMSPLAVVSVFVVLPASADIGSYTASANGALTFNSIAGVTLAGFVEPGFSCGDGSDGGPACPEFGGGSAGTGSSVVNGLDFSTVVSGSGSGPTSHAFLGGDIVGTNLNDVPEVIVFTLTYNYTVSHAGEGGAGGGINAYNGSGIPQFGLTFPPPSIGTGSGSSKFSITIPALSSNVEVAALGVGVGGAVPEPADAMWPMLGLALGFCALRKFKRGRPEKATSVR